MKWRIKLLLLIVTQLWEHITAVTTMPEINPGGGGAKAFFNNRPRSTLTKEERFLAKLDKFDEDIEAVKNDSDYKRQPGANLKKVLELKLDPLEILKKQANKGITLEVINLSRRVLGDPRVYTRCGWQDKNYGEIQELSPGENEVFIFHNKDRSMRSSCGSVSWQVMDNAGRAHRVPGGNGLRLFLTWSTLDTGIGGNKCKKDKRNEFVMGFQEIKLDSLGHEVGEWDETDVYKKYHTTEKLKETYISEGNTLTALLDSPDGELEVKAIMGPDCQSVVSIEVLGKHAAQMEIVNEDEEVFVADEIWEQMIRQAWLDIVKTINREKALYGVGLKPLLLDPLMPEPIAIKEDMAGYNVNLAMWNISIDGLDHIKLERLLLERGQALNNLREKAIIDIGNLTIKGMYKYTAECSNWFCIVNAFDSEGEQPFKISMSGAKFNVIVKLDTINGCGQENNMVITNIEMPLEYVDVDFDFTNIGTVLGAIVGTIGNIALSFSQGLIVDVVKQNVASEVPTFLCDADKYNTTKMEKIPVEVNQQDEPLWHALLQEGHKGWGWNTLRRDYLAEQFVTKAFNDGLVTHLSNDSDPIVQALDPFQLLPASEDIHEKGLIKGHIVACELWLKGLKDLTLDGMELVRNEDLTYSAMKVDISLPAANLTGKFRLNNVKVMSVFNAKDSEGTIHAALTGVKVGLTVVIQTVPVLNEGDSRIKVTHFEVKFDKDRAKIDVNGLGGKIISKISNKAIKIVGNKVLDMQKAMLNTEIRNILWGMVKCLMYKPGMDFQKCQDEFWSCLGLEVPFVFPKCEKMYKEADEEIAKFSSYKEYLKDHEAKAAIKAEEQSGKDCLAV
eukprot:GFUD01042614.1.p1 GENE.GFUD01042614.1~~GFUD01042614.1.p1  ORF type:complete len:843 (+),score=261.12 GFUD01042614.1:84-2612(+)